MNTTLSVRPLIQDPLILSIILLVVMMATCQVYLCGNDTLDWPFDALSFLGLFFT